MRRAQVHRFGDSVAGWLGSGDTAYMTPLAARQLARALLAAADDCEQRGAADSQCGTFAIELEAQS